MKKKLDMKKQRLFIALCIVSIIATISVVFSINRLDARESILDTNDKATSIEYSEDVIEESEDVDNVNDIIKISSLGNIIIHEKQLRGAKTDTGYDFTPSFSYIKEITSNADLSIGIMEGTFSGEPYSGYPTFSSPDEVLIALRDSGVDVINYANNHIIDKGVTGYNRTLEITESNNLDALGVRKKSDDKKYLVKDIQGHKIGLMAYVFQNRSSKKDASINNIPIPSELDGLINTFDYDNLEIFYNDMEEQCISMQDEGVKFIIVSVHWGEEYDTKENQFQRNMASRLSDIGVDIVLGGHPHVIQPYEIIENSQGKKTFISYSQGNILSNQCSEEIGNPKTEDGIIINFTLEANEEEINLKEYEIIPTWVYREPKDGNAYTHRIIPVEDAINNKEKYKLTNSAYDRIKKSLTSTNSIIGHN